MTQVVLTVGPDGTINTLLQEKHFSLAALGGHKHVVRVSEVLFDEPAQKFYIKWLKGPLAGQEEANRDIARSRAHFDTYELAVEAEVRRVNDWRQRGLFNV